MSRREDLIFRQYFQLTSKWTWDYIVKITLKSFIRVIVLFNDELSIQFGSHDNSHIEFDDNIRFVLIQILFQFLFYLSLNNFFIHQIIKFQKFLQ